MNCCLCGINIGKGFIDELPVIKNGKNYCHVCVGREHSHSGRPRTQPKEGALRRREKLRQKVAIIRTRPLSPVTTINFNTRPLIADRAAFDSLPQEHKDRILNGSGAFEQLLTRGDFLGALKKVSKRREI